jgi:hypothetical protein
MQSEVTPTFLQMAHPKKSLLSAQEVLPYVH